MRALKTTLAISGVLFGTPALAFNSDEHKMIGDFGSSNVHVCGPGVARRCRPAQIANGAIVLAAGYVPAHHPQVELVHSANSPANAPVTVGHDAYRSLLLDWDKIYDTLKERQGGQHKYHVNMHAPPAASGIDAAAPLVVWVGSANDPRRGQYFSFGDLVALYGDYRRPVTCDQNNNSCLLTDRNDFATTVELAELRMIALGRNPPFGVMGNFTANSGGTPSDSPWWGDEMMRLAFVNDWHFGRIAVEWYVAMHRQALLFARLAADHNDDTYLWKALHFEANGLHSLTDLFAPGHMLTDREESVASIYARNHVTEQSNAMYRWYHQALGTAAPNTGAAPPTLLAPPSSVVDSSTFVWAIQSKMEEGSHTHFNDHGARVRGLEAHLPGGPTAGYPAFGDGKLFLIDRRGGGAVWRNQDQWRKVTETVQASLTTLFDAYWAFRQAPTVPARNHLLRQLVDHADYYEALRTLPVEVNNACFEPRRCLSPQPNTWKKTVYRDLVEQYLAHHTPASPIATVPPPPPVPIPAPQLPALPHLHGTNLMLPGVPQKEAGSANSEYFAAMGQEP